MAESECLCRPPQKKLLSDSDMAAAAEQLMQLSDEDCNNCEYKSNDKETKKKKLGDGEYMRRQNEITWAKIEEIFGKEEEEIYRPKKKRYRSLVGIYMTTKPMPLEKKRRSMH
ncbi:hypothetical protein Patl1_27678 [Pistacia atlantica]|uniref:Uncharacterized protein n=1 Tax=Pistacia atlantica TaxID=434234 RepID=A0ACC1BBX2_9ROSI|nr:hypothetical protein Patl1_27678 [Pistacia atlantica]